MSVFSLNVSIDDGAVIAAENIHSTASFFYEKFKGESLEGKWESPVFHFSDDEGGVPENDFTSCLSEAAYVISPKAADVLKQISNKGFELLNAVVANREPGYCVLNVIYVADCLDKKNTEFLYSRDDPNKLLMMTRPNFIADKVPDTGAFKIPQTVDRIFVNFNFVELVLKHKLTGVYFEDPAQESFRAKRALFGTPFKNKRRKQ